jgi:outer membrane biosynthesis protein TonB
MKITVKTLSGKQLPIEIEPTLTIREVKQAIEKEHDLKADSLKLIAYGKVLDNDDKTASEYNIKENDFIVAMVQKAKPAPKKKDEPKEEAKQEDAPQTANQPPAQPSQPAPQNPPAQQPSQPAPQNPPAQEVSQPASQALSAE